MGSVQSKWKDADHPVEQVSWDDAVEFCRRLSAMPDEKSMGRFYRLPTEAEWEFACRAGTTTQFSFGDDESDLSKFGWAEKSASQTQPVRGKKPNAWGLYDMHGNVWEWCGDWDGQYPQGEVTDPTGTATGIFRVYRGGGWLTIAPACRSANRAAKLPDFRCDNLGFRVALTPTVTKSLELGIVAKVTQKPSSTAAAGAQMPREPKSLKLFKFSGDHVATAEEANAMLLWLGATITGRDPGDGWVTGRLRPDLEITIWPKTYGKDRCYGVRFGNPDAGGVTPESYFEVCRNQSPAVNAQSEIGAPMKPAIDTPDDAAELSLANSVSPEVPTPVMPQVTTAAVTDLLTLEMLGLDFQKEVHGRFAHLEVKEGGYVNIAHRIPGGQYLFGFQGREPNRGTTDRILNAALGKAVRDGETFALKFYRSGFDRIISFDAATTAKTIADGSWKQGPASR